jgi:hypothetical protein
MARPGPLSLVLSLLAAMPLAAQERPFENVDTAAAMIKTVIDNATLRPVSGKRQLLVLWQEEPGNVEQLGRELRRILPDYTTSVATEEAIGSLKTRASLVSVVAVGLSPDTLQLLSYQSRALGLLTIGAEADIDPLSVGLELEGTLIHCSATALAAERVAVKFRPCRELPVERTEVPDPLDKDIIRKTTLHSSYAERRQQLNGWKSPVPPNEKALRAKLLAFARTIQHEIGVKPKEEWIPGPFSGNRARYPFLPFYQLGRVFYLLDRCNAALPALQESEKRNLAASVAPEKAELARLLAECGRKQAALTGPVTFTASRERYWRIWGAAQSE